MAPQEFRSLLTVDLEAGARPASDFPGATGTHSATRLGEHWRARKIQAELEKLGFTISLATVSRYLPKRRLDLDRRQCWTTFLRNHRGAIAAMDFLVVPTARFKMLYVWFIIEHGRRWILHVNVTARPTSSWTIQQLREAIPDEHSLRFLIHDNDTIFSDRVVEAIGHLGIESKRTEDEY